MKHFFLILGGQFSTLIDILTIDLLIGIAGVGIVAVSTFMEFMEKLGKICKAITYHLIILSKRHDAKIAIHSDQLTR